MNVTETSGTELEPSSPELELALPSPAGVLTMGSQPGTSPVTLQQLWRGEMLSERCLAQSVEYK